MVGVPAGCFADGQFPVPTRLYWATRRHHWLTLPAGVEVLDTQ